jgi:transcriptional regulator with XRE-family HTH domain
MSEPDALIAEVRALRRLPTPSKARAIRQAAGISQARLAEHLGVDRVTVTRWERGLRRPRGDLALKYGDFLAALRAEVGR